MKIFTQINSKFFRTLITICLSAICLKDSFTNTLILSIPELFEALYSSKDGTLRKRDGTTHKTKHDRTHQIWITIVSVVATTLLLLTLQPPDSDVLFCKLFIGRVASFCQYIVDKMNHTTKKRLRKRISTRNR